MSRIEITIGNASVDFASSVDVETPDGIFAKYNPRELMDATAAALLAVNTPRSIAWAHELYRMTAAPAGPSWVGTTLETCIRDVALGRIARHSLVTAEMVDEWRRLNPDRAAPTGPDPRTDAAVGR